MRRSPTGCRSAARLVVLAGYMELLGEPFLARFPGAVINVHPSLLPAFPGLGAIEQALAYGVKVFGVTVHFVDDGVDSGPVILQRAVELPDARDAAGGAGGPAPARARAAGGGRAPVRARRAEDRPREPAANDRRSAGGRRGRGIGSENALRRRPPTRQGPVSSGPRPGEVRVRRALLSVSEKDGIVDFARGLEELGVEIVSTGGTARELGRRGRRGCEPIEDFTGFPEIMDGRVKTLHPRLYAGLLARRDDDAHLGRPPSRGSSRSTWCA